MIAARREAAPKVRSPRIFVLYEADGADPLDWFDLDAFDKFARFSSFYILFVVVFFYNRMRC